MSSRIARFLRKIMCDISKAPHDLFLRYYYERTINDQSLEACIRACAFSGTNIFLLGRTGEGKTCFLRNYELKTRMLDVGYSNIKSKPVFYLSISFDSPEWSGDLTNSELLEKIVLGLENYLGQYSLFPPDYPHDETIRRRYHEAISVLNQLNFEKKDGQLLVLIDDIDHAPFDFQISFLNAIYPLLRSPGCVCVYAVRHAAYSTALTRTNGRLATAFVEFQTVELDAIPIRSVTELRIKNTIDDQAFLTNLEEPDLSLKDLKVEYLIPETIDNWIQQYSCGNIRTMSHLMIQFTEEFEKIRERNEEPKIGRTKLLEIASPHLINIFNKQNKEGYSLAFSVLEMLRCQSRVDEAFYSVLQRAGFDKPSVDHTIDELLESDVIEEALIADSFSRMHNALSSIQRSYVLTCKGNWLITMATWKQYAAIFKPPKKTLMRGGEIFENRIVCEFLEFLRDALLQANHKRPVILLNWTACFNEFYRYSQALPPRSGSPGQTGFNENQLYRILEKASLVDKRLSDYPKAIAINRVSFESACQRVGISYTMINPFADQLAMGEIARQILHP